MSLKDPLGSMAARVFVLLCAGIVAAAALAFAAADLQRRQAERHAREQRFVERVTDLANVLERAPRAMRLQLLGFGPEAPRLASPRKVAGAPDADLTAILTQRLSPGLVARVSQPSARLCAPPAPPGAPPPPPAAEFGRRSRSGSAPPPPPPRPPAPIKPRPPLPPECRLVMLSFPGGDQLALTAPVGPRPPPDSATPFSPLALSVLALGAAALAFLVARLATAPLRRLAAAADALGRDLDRPPLTEEGPTEVRRGARAFNAMQARLRQRERERTHMLAAITHDLQTPLTRLRLRLEKVADPGLRDNLIADQAAMLELIRDGLDLARAAHADPTPLRDLDVDSLLESLCEDATEAGARVAVTARCGVTVRTRPEALKRCVANLLDNAIKHAGAAELSCCARGGDVELRVLDRGPGIPREQLASVLEPFVRLETSRSRDTGGAGLGLTIARLMSERAQGQLRLENRPGGGLCATVQLLASTT